MTYQCFKVGISETLRLIDCIKRIWSKAFKCFGRRTGKGGKNWEYVCRLDFIETFKQVVCDKYSVII